MCETGHVRSDFCVLTIKITPAAGYVGAPASVAIGVVAAIAANYGTRLKFLLNVDDTLDVFASHAIGGMVGASVITMTREDVPKESDFVFLPVACFPSQVA
jgi:ammonia channel protein AmtB